MIFLVAEISSHSRCLIERNVFTNFEKFKGKYMCRSLYFKKVTSSVLKKPPAQVFSCEFCKIPFKRTPAYQSCI